MKNTSSLVFEFFFNVYAATTTEILLLISVQTKKWILNEINVQNSISKMYAVKSFRYVNKEQ